MRTAAVVACCIVALFLALFIVDSFLISPRHHHVRAIWQQQVE